VTGILNSRKNNKGIKIKEELNLNEDSLMLEREEWSDRREGFGPPVETFRPVEWADIR
jgi:hypothetical protein